jgi:hypothetical protein
MSAAGRSAVLLTLLVSTIVLTADCGRVPLHRTVDARGVVPWKALPVGHANPTPYPASSVSPLSIPAGTPACQTSQLEGVRGFGGVATGHLNIPFVLRNRGTASCTLQGFPDLALLDRTGSALADATGTNGHGTFFADGPDVPVLLVAGTPPFPSTPEHLYSGVRGQAYFNVEWFDCRQRVAASARLTLPGSEPFSLALDMPGPFSPVCDSPGYRNAYGLSRGPISPSGFQWPPPPDFLPIEIKLSLPATVRRGTTLDYRVTISNNGNRDYDLGTCPDYQELFGGKLYGAAYRLNCSAASVIPPGGSVTFEMRFEVPPGSPTGPLAINWVLLDGRVNLEYQKNTITVTA